MKTANIDYKEKCEELEAKVEKLENMVADLIETINKQAAPKDKCEIPWKTERRAEAICKMINRGLKVLNIEAILVIDPYQSTISIIHTYANHACIDISKPEYTFPISMLDI